MTGDHLPVCCCCSCCLKLLLMGAAASAADTSGSLSLSVITRTYQCNNSCCLQQQHTSLGAGNAPVSHPIDLAGYFPIFSKSLRRLKTRSKVAKVQARLHRVQQQLLRPAQAARASASASAEALAAWAGRSCCCTWCRRVCSFATFERGVRVLTDLLNNGKYAARSIGWDGCGGVGGPKGGVAVLLLEAGAWCRVSGH
jgi:hypothetical protein